MVFPISSLAKELDPSPIEIIGRKIEESNNSPGSFKFNGGAPSFDRPPELTNALAEIVRDKISSRYTSAGGHGTVIQSIVNYLKTRGFDVTQDNIMIHPCGGSSAITNIILATINPGDEVILTRPTYPAYQKIVECVAKGKVKFINLDPESGIDIEDFKELVTGKTRLLIYPSPDNPTGYFWSKEQTKAVAEIAKDHHFLVAHDQAYEQFLYEGEHFTSWKLGFEENSAAIWCLSKEDSDPGCRGSYTLTPPEITKAMKNISGQMNLCPNAVTQFEIKWVVEHPEIINSYVQEVKAEYDLRRQAMVNAFKQHLPKTRLKVPLAGFYCFPDLSDYTNGQNDTDVLGRLEKEANVWALPGSLFAMPPKDGWSRWTYVSETTERIDTGVRKAYECLSNLRK